MRAILRTVAAISLALLWSCGPPAQRSDAGVDAWIAPGRPCSSDSDCEDMIACTIDRCRDGFCRPEPLHAMCDDRVFCNGAERCDTSRGCGPGESDACDDGDVCTVDRCVEETQTCDRSARDLDGDGDADFVCEGGGDCDDRDPTRSSTRNEQCGDVVDNDCDMQIDESACGSPDFDRCDAPLDVSAGGLFEFSTEGAAADYDLACAVRRASDIVIRFTLTESRDVFLEADAGTAGVAVALSSTCPVAGPGTVECARGISPRLARRALAPGTYFAVVATDRETSGLLDVRFADPSSPASNETCASALDVSGGGTFSGSLLDARSDVASACGAAQVGELVYTLRLPAAADVTVRAAAETGRELAWELRPSCERATATLRCATGAPARGTLHQVPAGNYTLLLRDIGRNESPFELQVTLGPPTPPLAGDVCSSALPLSVGTTVHASFSGLDDDVAPSCSLGQRDVVFTFTNAALSDLLITATDQSGAYLSTALRRICADAESELRCAYGSPSRTLLHGVVPGTYFLIVESPSPTSEVDVQVTASAASPSTPASSNDSCSSATLVPENGGLYLGSTVGLSDTLHSPSSCGGMTVSPNAVFRWNLPRRTAVRVSTDGSAFDTVLYVYRDRCGDDVLQCSDDDPDAPPSSVLTATLDAGAYFFVVDGWGMDTAGEYAIRFEVTE